MKHILTYIFFVRMKDVLLLVLTFLLVIRLEFYQVCAAEKDCWSGEPYPINRQECGELGFSVKCIKKNLKEVPKSFPRSPYKTNESRICLLDLSFNHFHHLQDNAFSNVTNLDPLTILRLYLQNCDINQISSYAFQDLSNLIYLNLSGNVLSWPDSFGKGVFRSLVNLKELNLKENKIYSFQGMGKELRYMKFLETLHAELCTNCSFGTDFIRLKNLSKLSLTGLSKQSCNASIVRNDTFVGVPKLQHLWLSNCNIERIEEGAFYNVKNSLVLLDISKNERLLFKGMNAALIGLRDSKTLTELSINQIHPLYDCGIRVTESDIENIKTLKVLEILNVDLNKIEVFDKSIFYPTFQLPGTLRNISLAGNRLVFGDYVNQWHNAKNIYFLDISKQHLTHGSFLNNHNEPEMRVAETKRKKRSSYPDCPCEKPHVVCIPQQMHKITWRSSFIYVMLEDNITICGAEKLRHLDLSFNLFTKWKSTITGLEHLHHLDLSDNYCDEVSPTFFESISNLKSLNISSNFLEESLDPAKSNYSGKVFRKLKDLTNLDLSNNKIERLSKDVFEHLTNLKYLNLSSNMLDEWNSSLNMINTLKWLDLSGNKLTSLPTKLTDYLDNLCRYGCDFVLILSSNPFQCKCESLPFLKWILSTKVVVRFSEEDECILKPGKFSLKRNLRAIKDYLEKEACEDKSLLAWIVGSVVSGLIACTISVVVCRLVYINRWKLRYLYYSRNRRYRHEGFGRLFENDAFVSYPKSKASFIKSSMVPSLEKQRGIRLWVTDRNSIPGNSVAENITHAIYNSRKSVLLIDQDYLKDSWCDYERNMAHLEGIEAKRKLIILVLMERIPLENLPINIMSFFRSEKSLEYPEDDKDLDTFWTNLANEIMCI